MTSLHPAITRAAALYDETDESGQLRPLAQFEQDFLTAERHITGKHARDLGEARRMYGDGTTLFNAIKFRMDADLADDLTHALEQYEAAIEAQDSELEYLLGVVAEEMETTPFAEAAE
jgi:hypothetical protein